MSSVNYLGSKQKRQNHQKMEEEWQNQLSIDLRACFESNPVENCLSVISEYEMIMNTNIDWTETAPEMEEFMTEEEAESLRIILICINCGVAVGIGLLIYLAYRLYHWLIPKIEDSSAKKYTSNRHYRMLQLEKNPDNVTNQILFDVSILTQIKMTYKHRGQVGYKLYKDVVNSLEEYKNRQRKAFQEASARVDQSQSLKNQPS